MNVLKNWETKQKKIEYKYITLWLDNNIIKTNYKLMNAQQNIINMKNLKKVKISKRFKDKT